MAGMIWNANHVLTAALDPKKNGVPRKLFEQDLKGILLISTVEVGFIFTGNVGAGILMSRQGDTWSPPCAVGVGGIGWGFVVGGAIKDIMVFIFDEETVMAIAGRGIALGAQGELTLGPFGRAADLALNLSQEGVGTTAAVAFTKGLFAGVSLEGAMVGARNKVNQTFYKKPYTPLHILYEDNIELPEGTLMPDVYAKLNKLMEGGTHETSREEEELVEAAREEAHRLGEAAAADDSDVIRVDAKAEAEKETASSS